MRSGSPLTATMMSSGFSTTGTSRSGSSDSAKSGAARVSPLMYLPNGDDVVIFASKAGAPSNPDWYYNLVANPDATIEIGSETVAVRARVAEGAERDELWERQKAAYPQFAEYEANKIARLGPEAARPHRVTHRRLTR